MDWKFKEDAEPQGSSEGFWYDITDGGYIEPAGVLADEEQIEALDKAISLVHSFEAALINNNLLNEF